MNTQDYQQWKEEVEQTKEYDKWCAEQDLKKIFENDPKLNQLLKEIKNESLR